MKTKRMFALVLCVAMMLALAPFSAYAADGLKDPNTKAEIILDVLKYKEAYSDIEPGEFGIEDAGHDTKAEPLVEILPKSSYASLKAGDRVMLGVRLKSMEAIHQTTDYGINAVTVVIKFNSEYVRPEDTASMTANSPYRVGGRNTSALISGRGLGYAFTDTASVNADEVLVAIQAGTKGTGYKGGSEQYMGIVDFEILKTGEDVKPFSFGTAAPEKRNVINFGEYGAQGLLYSTNNSTAANEMLSVINFDDSAADIFKGDKQDPTHNLAVKNGTYNGSALDLVTGSVTGGTATYAVVAKGASAPADATAAKAQATEPGEYDVYFKITGTTGYNNIGVTKLGTATIAKAKLTFSGITANNRTYDGTEKDLLKGVPASITGGALHYTVDGGADTTTAPKGKNAKAYTIKIKAVATDTAHYVDSDEATVNTTISKAQLTATAKSYGIKVGAALPAAYEVEVTGFVGGETAATAAGYTAPTAACPTADANTAASYDIVVSGGTADNYTFKYANGKLTVADKTPLALPTGIKGATGLIADGSEKTLLTGIPASVEHGELQYSVNGGAYSTTVPVATDAGEYKIKYKVVATDTADYSDSPESAEITVTIAAPAEPDKVTVKYDVNGGELAEGVTIPDAQVNEGGTVTVTDVVPTKDGSAFLGWKAGDKLYKAGETVTVTADTTLTAQYATINIDITSINKNKTKTATVTTDAGAGYTVEVKAATGDDKLTAELTDDTTKVDLTAGKSTGNAVVKITADIKDAEGNVVGTITEKEFDVKIKSGVITGGGNGNVGWPTSSASLKVRENISGVVGGTGKVDAVLENSTSKITYTSDNEDVVTVDEDGNLTYVGEGTAVVTATAGSLTAKTTVTVSKEDDKPAIDTNYTKPYAKGYEDGTFKPQNNLTRAELAAMIARLSYGDEIPNSYNASFPDAQGAWYSKYIGYLENLNVLNGYEDGTFQPQKTVTRGEVCAVIARAQKFNVVSGETDFTDIQDYWGKDYITTLADKGIVSGYNDGSFAPQASITRAETVAIINRVLAPSTPVVTFTPSDISGHWAEADIILSVNERKVNE